LKVDCNYCFACILLTYYDLIMVHFLQCLYSSLVYLYNMCKMQGFRILQTKIVSVHMLHYCLLHMILCEGGIITIWTLDTTIISNLVNGLFTRRIDTKLPILNQCTCNLCTRSTQPLLYKTKFCIIYLQVWAGFKLVQEFIMLLHI